MSFKKNNLFLLVLIFSVVIQGACSSSSGSGGSGSTHTTTDNNNNGSGSNTQASSETTTTATTYDVTLSDLTIESNSVGGLSPEFSSSVTDYDVAQNFLSPNTFSFTATTTDKNAVLLVNDDEATSGKSTSVQLDEVDYAFDISVIAPDLSDSDVYSVSVSRNPLQEQAYIKASESALNTQTQSVDSFYFGAAVALSGNTLVVGAPYADSQGITDVGAVYVYNRDANGEWSFDTKLMSDVLPVTADGFGSSVAISGDTIVVGAFGVDDIDTNAGAAYVFERDSSGAWQLTKDLNGSLQYASDNFGSSVAVDGDTIVVSSPGDDVTASDSGAAYVFVKDKTGWQEQAYLKSTHPQASDFFGKSVSISGDVVVVGDSDENGSAIEVNGIDDNSASFQDAGAAYVFERSGTSWEQTAYLKASNTTQQKYFGQAVAVSGDHIAVGERYDSSDTDTINGNFSNTSAPDSGAVFTYKKAENGYWVYDSYIKAPNSDAGDNFGYSVSLDGENLVVGAISEDSDANTIDGDWVNNNLSYAGAAYVYRLKSDSTWEEVSYIKSHNPDGGDSLGYSVAVSGDTVAVGAISEAGSGTGVNSKDDNLAAGSGAVYVFQ